MMVLNLIVSIIINCILTVLLYIEKKKNWENGYQQKKLKLYIIKYYESSMDISISTEYAIIDAEDEVQALKKFYKMYREHNVISIKKYNIEKDDDERGYHVFK